MLVYSYFLIILFLLRLKNSCLFWWHSYPYFDGVQTLNWTNFPILLAIYAIFAWLWCIVAQTTLPYQAILVGKIRNIIANYGYEAKKLTNKFTVQKIENCDIQKFTCNFESQAAMVFNNKHVYDNSYLSKTMGLIRI